MTYPMFWIACLFATPAPTTLEADQAAALVAKLGHPRFAVREKASKDLAAMGVSARIALRDAFKSADAETANRAHAIDAKIVDGLADSLWPWPFIDAHWYDTEARWYSQPIDMTCIDFLQTAGPDGRPWHHYRIATGAWIKEKLNAGAGVKGLRMLLAEMHRRDAVFIGTQPPRDDEQDPPWAVDWQTYLAGAHK